FSIPSPSLSNAPPTTTLYTLSLHDALPIYLTLNHCCSRASTSAARPEKLFTSAITNGTLIAAAAPVQLPLPPLTVTSKRMMILRSEEHTSELQSRENLVCRLLLEKKKKTTW